MANDLNRDGCTGAGLSSWLIGAGVQFQVNNVQANRDMLVITCGFFSPADLTHLQTVLSASHIHCGVESAISETY